ncbi:MAG: hypothetical protein ACI8TP_000629 [Acidimicrobiales bacterium]|jgi:hypothetical protein
MARHRAKNGRVTTNIDTSGDIRNELAPLRKRRPAVFWMVIIGTLAMVLTTFASCIQAVS